MSENITFSFQVNTKLFFYNTQIARKETMKLKSKLMLSNFFYYIFFFLLKHYRKKFLADSHSK